MSTEQKLGVVAGLFLIVIIAVSNASLERKKAPPAEPTSGVSPRISLPAP
jgi:hypothetical protein